MEPAKLQAWLEKTIRDHLPGDGSDAGARLMALLGAAAAIRAGSGMLFGMNATSSDIAAVKARVEPLFDEALRAWQAWLPANFGAEGGEFYATMCKRSGYAPDDSDDDVD